MSEMGESKTSSLSTNSFMAANIFSYRRAQNRPREATPTRHRIYRPALEKAVAALSAICPRLACCAKLRPGVLSVKPKTP